MRVLQLKHVQLVFQPTTCRNGLNLCIIFVKLVLKIDNLVPNMCVTKNFYNFTYNLLPFESVAYRLVSQPIILCALYDKMAAESVCHRYCAKWNAIICPIISICVDFLQGEGKFFTASVCISARSTEQRDSFLNSGNTRVDQSFGE